MINRANPPYKAGIILEETVADGLRQLGVEYRRTDQWSEEDVEDQLDLIIAPGGGRPELEIQITLRAKNYNKIFGFARRALTTTTRGIRLYIEVVGLHRRSADLKAVGYRVAEAIRVIVRQFRDFGTWNLLGVRIHAFTAKIEKFDLVEFCGRRLISLVEAWQEARHLEQERLRTEEQQRRLASERAQKERNPAAKPEPFWKRFLDPSPRVHRHERSHPRFPNLDFRPFFQPRRLC